jgi:serine/threonine protein kinase
MQYNDIDSAFEFERLIASTSKSNIWLAKRKSSERDQKFVVIKEIFLRCIVNPQHVLNERAVLRLLTELHFPRSPSFLGTSKTSDSLFIIQSLIEGAPLHMHIPNSGLDADTARWYLGEILDIMQFLHGQNIVYRDLKLSNLVLQNGRLFLVDFGHAKILANRCERTNSICGTAHAMAPEVSRGDSYGFECDFWSLGVLMYELLTGRIPNLSGEEPLDLSYLKDEGARVLIQRLLERDPSERLSSFSEMRESKFFETCSPDWWKSVRSLSGNPSDVPWFDPRKGKEFIFGRDSSEDVFANF